MGRAERRFWVSDEASLLAAIPARLIMPYLSVSQRLTWKRFEIVAIDATDAYIAVVTEIMEGLPVGVRDVTGSRVLGKPRSRPACGSEEMLSPNRATTMIWLACAGGFNERSASQGSRTVGLHRGDSGGLGVCCIRSCPGGK